MNFWTGLYLVSFLSTVFGFASASYTVYLNKESFKDAQTYCKPGSFLTNIPNAEEIQKILKAIWNKSDKTAISFWIGLKKNRGVCVKQDLPLKGFYWTVDNSSESYGNVWKTDPSGTCVEARCGLLSVEYSSSGAINTGLTDAVCKQQHAFICKRNTKISCPSPTIFGTHDIIEKPDDPDTRELICSSNARFTLTCSRNLVWTLAGNENTDISQLCLECKSGFKRSDSGYCEDINECKPFNPCKLKCINTEGSYKCVCPDSNGGLGDCDESTPPTTALKNDDKGLKSSKDDRDKSVPTSPTPLPNDGSTNVTPVYIEESTEDISNIIVPVIIALLIFIVLLVIIAAIVKGCLRRRTVKLARRKAETVALNGSSSMEKVNEKEET